MVDILAPGEDIWSTALHNRYENRTGTSMAAPHVTGTIALMASVNPDLSAYEYKRILITSANHDINPPGVVSGNAVEGNQSSVWGLLNARKALEGALSND